MTPSNFIDVLALDPGEKVGWARGCFDLDNPENEPSDLAHGITPLLDMGMGLVDAEGDYDVLVYETFRLFPGSAKRMTGSSVPTAQFVGMARLAAAVQGWKIAPQSPAGKRTAAKTAPKWLQQIIINEPKAHDDAHNVDALLHLWHYIWRTYVAK